MRSFLVVLLIVTEVAGVFGQAGPITELWGYVAPGAERNDVPAAPITDWAFFGPSVNPYGELTNLPNPEGLRFFPGRKHLVLAIVDNAALTHMVLTPDFPVRESLLSQLVAAAEPYDGVQLDFETIPSRDAEAFRGFLTDLKSRIGNKVLSLALPARTRVIDDPFAYAPLVTLADRILLMAYDEHWSGSSPGPIASLDWGTKVAEFALTQIPPEKLIMGAPFYGRAWADRVVSRAYTHGAIEAIRNRFSIATLRTESIPHFEYDETVHIHVFYEDAQSLGDRILAYRAQGVRNFGFWRIGQEDPQIWATIPNLGLDIEPRQRAPALIFRRPELLK